MNEFLKINGEKIKKIFHLEGLFKKMNPHVYWKVLLYCFFIVISILVFFGMDLLVKIKKEEIFQVEIVQSVKTSLMNEKLFNKITESFNIKAAKQKEIEKGLIKYKDPSLK